MCWWLRSSPVGSGRRNRDHRPQNRGRQRYARPSRRALLQRASETRRRNDHRQRSEAEMRTLKTLPTRQHSPSPAEKRPPGPRRGARGTGARGGSPAAAPASRPRGAVLKLLGRVRGVRRMNAAARESVARTYAEILRRRHPGTQWIVRPVKRDDGLEGDTSTGQVLRRLAVPEDADALMHGRLDPRAAHEDAVDPGAQQRATLEGLTGSPNRRASRQDPATLIRPEHDRAPPAPL